MRLEELIPAGHILRKIDQWIDFSIIHEKTEDLYSNTGRPSIDPEVLIRMMVVGYLYGITLERRLCREVQLNLAYRWFCGLSLEDKVADHSTFSNGIGKLNMYLARQIVKGVPGRVYARVPLAVLFIGIWIRIFLIMPPS